jgi:hypothetical protein
MEVPYTARTVDRLVGVHGFSLTWSGDWVKATKRCQGFRPKVRNT